MRLPETPTKNTKTVLNSREHRWTKIMTLDTNDGAHLKPYYQMKLSCLLRRFSI